MLHSNGYMGIDVPTMEMLRGKGALDEQGMLGQYAVLVGHIRSCNPFFFRESCKRPTSK